MFTYLEIDGTYGSGKIETTIFVAYNNRTGQSWYCVSGSLMVNLTHEEISDGVDVEELNDIDCFTVQKEINDLETFEKHLDD